jgi:hypothetical protein
MSSYTAYHKKYYENHKTEIQVKTKTYWNSYYERNKEAIRIKNLNRYYEKKAQQIETQEPLNEPPATPQATPPATSPV